MPDAAAASMPLDDPAVIAAVARWMPGTRWYPLKGVDATVSLVRAWHLDNRGAILLLRAGDLLLQVPVAWRSTAGAAPIAELGGRWLVDGCADEAAVGALLDAAAGGRTVAGLSGEATEVPATGAIRVISGEQSNTSIIGGDGAWIAKVFRVVAAGDNPDVVVTGALTRLGSSTVPHLLASLTGHWPVGEAEVSGHLLAVSSFVEGGEDAWALFREQAARTVRGEAAGDAPDARALGSAVAVVHRELGEALGTATASDDDVLRFVAGLEQRMAWARDEAGEALDELSAGLDAAADRLRAIARLGELQQIHGDLHLGQVLRDGHGRWILLDFEGEPLRPLHERMAREPRLRDVVGMLRSFDYAAGSALQDAPDGDPAAAGDWVVARQDEFLEGYGVEAGGVDRDDPVLRALLLDKALYEVVYELRNRPGWLPVPLAAVRALVG